MTHVSVGALDVRPKNSILRKKSLEAGTRRICSKLDCVSRRDSDTDGWCGFIGRGGPSVVDLESWPMYVSQRWRRVSCPKNRNELALLSWNTNGRLDLSKKLGKKGVC